MRGRAKHKKGSPGWCKQKVVDAFMKSYHGLPCEVCGVEEGTCAHHVVSKGSCPYHIATPEMVIVLCGDCHRWAHGGGLGNGKGANAFKVVDFMEWLEFNKPEQFHWCEAHQADTSVKLPKQDWITRYEEQA
jgi:hypothetical protein